MRVKVSDVEGAIPFKSLDVPGCSTCGGTLPHQAIKCIVHRVNHLGNGVLAWKSERLRHLRTEKHDVYPGNCGDFFRSTQGDHVLRLTHAKSIPRRSCARRQTPMSLGIIFLSRLN